VGLYAQQPQSIQAVLMDMIMPVMGGVQTIQTLRGLNPAVKVIAFSGLYTVAARDQSVEADVQAVLPKPYMVRDLLATVRSVLNAGPARTDEPARHRDSREPEARKGVP
jgi:CheY-like chemotaxis protein